MHFLNQGASPTWRLFIKLSGINALRHWQIWKFSWSGFRTDHHQSFADHTQLVIFLGPLGPRAASGKTDSDLPACDHSFTLSLQGCLRFMHAYLTLMTFSSHADHSLSSRVHITGWPGTKGLRVHPAESFGAENRLKCLGPTLCHGVCSALIILVLPCKGWGDRICWYAMYSYCIHWYVLSGANVK